MSAHPRRWESPVLKVKYKGYRIWAILQTNGKYRASFLRYPAAVHVGVDVNRIIEGDNQAETIAKAKEFLDGIPELNWTWPRTGSI